MPMNSVVLPMCTIEPTSFNLPDIDWESSTVKGHQLPRRVNEEFISMQHDLASEQMVLFPTRGQSPPRMKYEDWYCDLTVVMSFTSGSMYSPSVLLGGLYAADMMSFDCDY
jgi:hypothetical protein